MPPTPFPFRTTTSVARRSSPTRIWGRGAYSVDPLGQTWHQTDAKGQGTDFYFDSLGRLSQRIEAGPPSLTSTWTFDTCAYGVGKVCQATTSGGYSRTMSYDSQSRISSVTTTVGATTLTNSVQYDAYGRLQANVYSANAARQLVFGYGYNGYGLASTIMGAGPTAALGSLWSGTAANAWGSITQDVLGSANVRTRTFSPYTGRLTDIVVASQLQTDHYGYDPVGNLKSRSALDGSGGTVSEAFTYDALDRLSTSSVTGQAQKTFGYDNAGLGNLTSKAGVTQTYGATCGARTCPHAVSTVIGIAGAFSYDPNGNMTSGNLGAWNYAWTAGNQPYSITKNGVTETFAYGPERQKAQHTVSGTTIVYAGPLEVGITGSATTLKGFLPDGVGYVFDDGTSVYQRYFLQDVLGSPGGHHQSRWYRHPAPVLRPVGQAAQPQRFRRHRKHSLWRSLRLYRRGAARRYAARALERTGVRPGDREVRLGKCSRATAERFAELQPFQLRPKSPPVFC